MAVSRGNPWDFDPGPPPASGWAELFASTPNYRALGKAALGREAFRWHHGPMFYRGRLDGSAKVILVGQEGAQDESLSHRSFTGGTGSRMQCFLRFIGFDRSYLFLNSFVYPIFGQYTSDLRPLAQGPHSPIVSHRHRILDKAVIDGDARLIVAVGTAAKESVATWIRSHGGTAQPDALHLATLGSIPARVRVVGVLHPGSVATSGSAAIKADFSRAIGHIRDWLTADAAWLPADPGMTRDLSKAYVYGADPIPFRDFPFGTTPRLGRGGTSSNRTDNQRGIRLFSAHGKYNAAGAHLTDPSTATGTAAGYADDAGDLPYEPPRAHPLGFDPGPPTALARLLIGGEPGFPWPDFAALGITSDPSFGVGPIYRGRFADLSLIVLADPDAPDDVFTGRALSGDAGQWLQAFLGAAGLNRRYLILRPVPVDWSDLSGAARAGLVDDPRVQALHRELLARLKATNPGLGLVLAVGPQSRRLVPHVTPAGVTVVEAAAHGETGWKASWQAALAALSGHAYGKDLPGPSFAVPTTRGQLPRIDLPYGTPRWVGTSGDRAVRPTDTDLGRPSPDYLKWLLPGWAASLAPAPLTASEQAAVNQLP